MESPSKNSTVGIIGYGRFGQVLEELLKKDFSVLIYDKKTNDKLAPVLAAKTIFIATPISSFSDVIQEIAPQLTSGTTVIDVCSVKTYPVKIMQEFLPENVDIIASHPLFGPDSIREKAELKMMMHAVRNHHGAYNFWKHFFEAQKIQIIEMTPEEHDYYAAFSQGLTHYIGRILEMMAIKPTPIDTLSFKKLFSIKEQTCNDSWELYRDLQNYNPYSGEMQKEFLAALEKLKN